MFDSTLSKMTPPFDESAQIDATSLNEGAMSNDY